MSKKQTKFRPNENPKSISFTQKLNAIVDAVNRANNIKVSVKGGTGGILHSQKGHSIFVNLPKKSISKSGGGGGGTSTATTQWAEITQIPEYDDANKAKYIVEKVSLNASNEWVKDGSPLDITYAIGYEGNLDGSTDDAADIRNWFPWYGVGAIVRIIQRIDSEQNPSVPVEEWWIAETMIFGGKETESAIRVQESANPESIIPKPVWV